MVWLILGIGGALLVIGVLGQFLGMRRQPRINPEDKHMWRVVITVGSAVVALWIVFLGVAHLMHMQVIGRW